MTTETVPYDQLRPGYNYRADLPDIDQLATTIEADGLIQNLTVFAVPESPDTFEVVAGFRRYAALERLATEGRLPQALAGAVPVRRVAADDEVGLLLIALAENDHLNPHPMDEALHLAKLRDLLGETTVPTLVKRHGKSARYYQYRLALADLPEVLQEAVREGSLKIDKARVLMKRVPLWIVDLLLEQTENGLEILCKAFKPSTTAALAKAVAQAHNLSIVREHLEPYYHGRQWEGFAFDPDQLEAASHAYIEAQRAAPAQSTPADDEDLDDARPLDADSTEVPADTAPENPTSPKDFYTAKHLALARQERARHLQKRVASNRGHAMRVLVYYLSLQRSEMFHPRGELVLYEPSLTAPFDKPWIEQRQHPAGGIHLSWNSKHWTIDTIFALSDAEILAVAKSLIASAIGNSAPSEHYGYGEPGTRDDADDVLRLASHLGVQQVEDFVLSADWLAGYKKRGLIRLAIDSGAVETSEKRALEGKTIAELQRTILESPTRDKGFVPEELRFPRPVASQPFAPLIQEMASPTLQTASPSLDTAERPPAPKPALEL